jgi:ComF family protein
VNAVSSLLQGLTDLVFAPVCVGCGGPIATRSKERVVCSVCWARARPIPSPRCPRCWHPLPTATTPEPVACRACEDLRPAIRAVRSAFLLDGTVRDLVHALKYRGWTAAADSMARRLSAVPLPEEATLEIRYVVPVPLTAVRLRERGYNQAQLLAEAVAKLNDWTSLPLLRRARSTGSQTTLHPTERRANVAGAFHVPVEEVERLAGEHLLLLDDVWTTGATALACCEALLAAGARAVTVLTFARALPEVQRQASRLELAGPSSYPG